MLERTVLRRLVVSSPFRTTLPPLSTRQIRFQHIALYSSGMQSVTQADFWTGLIPKPFRRNRSALKIKNKPKSKDWNPATFFICIFMLIGSMSIQMIALRNEFAAFTRRADAKIDLLKEIIERVQKGEKVDVEGLLGTGDLKKEMEWEEVLKEIEKEDELWLEKKQKKPWRRPSASEEQVSQSSAAGDKDSANEPVKTQSKSNAPRGFY